MSKHNTEMSMPEIALFLTGQIVEFSQSSTRTILDGHQSRVKRVFSRFSNNADKKRRRLKLNFHLFIAYLTVVAVELQVSEYFRSDSKQIIDDIVELLYEAIHESSKSIDGGLVVGDEFIMDSEERNIILAELQRVDSTVFGNLSGLPRMGLTAIADMLLEKRLNEYREMWIDDMMRIGQDGFIALMPTRVYQHWSGDNPRSWQSVSFTLLLSAGLMPFSTAISQVLGITKLKR